MRVHLAVLMLTAACSSPSESSDAGSRPDGGTTPAGDSAVPRDASMPGTDASMPGSDAGAPIDAGPTEPCVRATLLWSEDFETGDYSRWTSSDYGNGWGDACQSNGFSTDRAVSGTRSHRSEIVCALGESHRGYGGLQFDGDSVVPAYTNTGTGIDAPHGVVNTYWSWLDAPYDFASGRWFSFWTVNSDCGWGERVITLGLEDASWKLTPAHIASTGGTVDFVPDPPTFPRAEWVRTTIYVNYHAGEMHVWQNGQSLLHATFSRPTNDICQWHWGAYASGDNTDVVLYEDDNAIWKLDEPWTDWDREPWLDETVPACD